ncbi:MAG: hypothetical protein ABIF01_00420 [Candidatus Micrarchaeota archaeon]
MLEVRSRGVPKSNERKVFLKTKASIPLIANILANTKADEIFCSPAIFSTIPKRALSALGKMRIRVTVVPLPRGRPDKHSKKSRHLALKLLRAGAKKRIVSERLGIPLRTVYWIGKKN